MKITLTFRLTEDVTPDYFAQRVAEACFSYGALRTGEAVVIPSDPTKEFKDGGPVVLPDGFFLGFKRDGK